MGGPGLIAQIRKPWPLGPPSPGPGFGVGASWRRSRRSSAASIELQPAPLMQPLCQAWKRIPAQYLETFLLEITHLALLSLTILSSHTTCPTYRPNAPSTLPSSRNRCLSLPQTVKHRPGAKTTPEPTPRTAEHIHARTRHRLQRNSTVVSQRRSWRSISEYGSGNVMAFRPPVGKEGD